MSFEDDMIDYGFWDGNDYLDYLMDEADRIQEKQREQEAQWEMFENYKYSPLEDEESSHYEIEDVDELFFAGYDKENKEEKWIKEIKKWEKECIIKLWGSENPIKAKLWNTYYSNNKGYMYSDKYKLWKYWLEEILSYEEFKEKCPDMWNELLISIYSDYIISALEKYFGDGCSLKYEVHYFKTFTAFKKLLKWIEANKSLWSDINSKYKHQIKEKESWAFESWAEVYNWRDDFMVWRTKNSTIYEEEKVKTWHNDMTNMYAWIEENEDVWDSWKNNHLSLWNECYADYEKALWIIYTEEAWEKHLLAKTKKIVKRKSYLLTQEELFDFLDLSMKYDCITLDENDIKSWLAIRETESNEEKKLFFKTKCSEKGLKEFIYNQNKYLFDHDLYISAENYANRKVMELWIEKNNNQWNNWNFRYSLNEKYCNAIKHNHYELEDYYKAWKEVYPRKWKSWIEKGYQQWKKCKINTEIWLLWLSDGNIFEFNKWANKNIDGWEELMLSAMESDLNDAFYATYQNAEVKLFNCHDSKSYMLSKMKGFSSWLTDNSEEWYYWKDYMKDYMFMHKWIDLKCIKHIINDLEKPYISMCNLEIKMDELRYLSKIGRNIFIEGLAIIEIDNKYGFFNENKELVVPLIYDMAKDFHNGYAPVCIENRNIESEDILFYNEINPLWGIIDKKGKIIAPIIYNKILQITKEYAVVIKDYFKYEIFDLSNGNEINLPMYVDIRILDNGMWVACDKENDEYKWALISPKGNISPIKYSYIFNSDNDFAMVVKNAILSDNNNGYIWGEWGYIDKEGNEVEELKEFDSPYSFQKYWIDNHKISGMKPGY